MSSTQYESRPTHVKVIAMDPSQRIIISPSFERLQLLSGTTEPRESPEAAARRIAGNEELGLPPFKINKYLGTVEDVTGFACRAVFGRHINLRQFTVRGFDFDDIVDQLEENPGYFDPTDYEFLRQMAPHLRSGR